MKLIIDIPEREYKVICENNYVAVCACPNLLSNAIKKAHLYPTMRHLVIFADSIHQVVQTENLVVCVLLREGGK